MRRTMVAAAGLLLVLTVLVGCTGDEGSEPPASAGGPEAGPAERLDTTASIGKVAGKLGKKRRRAVLDAATTTVDEWLDAAYVMGDYPRSDFGKKVYPRFTKVATALARKQPKVMSNAAVGERVDEVTVTKRRVVLDVLAPGNRPAGVTARVDLVMELDGKVQRTDRVRGRLLLTPTRGGWKVFGFDVRRNVVKGSRK